MLVSFNWLKEYVGEKIPSVEEITELLTFYAFEIDGVEEKKDDTVIDVKILPDRSADCLCHLGVAREIATLINEKLEKDPFAFKPEMLTTDKVKITISDENACRHFDAALITGIEIKESPDWLQDRLKAIGQRSVNNVVDATNYVMFALGQPLHAYDAKKFPQKNGIWHFGVRFARNAEKITTLTGEEYELDSSIQIIVEGESDTPAGIAGIKGGQFASVDRETTDIILEAANFDPSITRLASQKLKLQTDASKRFENAISSKVVPYALHETVSLILDIAGGKCEGYAHANKTHINNSSVGVSLSHINSLLGLTLNEGQVTDILNRLGFENSLEGDNFSVLAPFYRIDIVIAEDIIAEIGRIHGYDKVQSVVPETVALSEYNSRHYYSEKVRGILIIEGFSEVITSSFRNKDDIQLLNALASDKSYLRSGLTKNLTEVLDKNALHTDLLGTEDTRVFEIGTVFEKDKEGRVIEHLSLALGVRIRTSGYSGKEDKIIDFVTEQIASSLGAEINWHSDKGVVETDFTELIERLTEPTNYEPVNHVEEITYKPFSFYPAISRDIALWVNEGTSVGEVEKVLNDMAGVLRVRTTHIDEFEKEGRISQAFRLVFQSSEKTLTDEEVNTVMGNIYSAVAEQNWEVR